MTTPATLLPHSQQQVTTKIKDFLRNSLSQHNKFCDRRTIVEHIVLIVLFLFCIIMCRPIDQVFYDVINDEVIDIQRNPKEFEEFLAEYGLTLDDFAHKSEVENIVADTNYNIELAF